MKFVPTGKLFAYVCLSPNEQVQIMKEMDEKTNAIKKKSYQNQYEKYIKLS